MLEKQITSHVTVFSKFYAGKVLPLKCRQQTSLFQTDMTCFAEIGSDELDHVTSYAIPFLFSRASLTQ